MKLFLSGPLGGEPLLLWAEDAFEVPCKFRLNKAKLTRQAASELPFLSPRY
jgi:hypothetical protein